MNPWRKIDKHIRRRRTWERIARTVIALASLAALVTLGILWLNSRC